MSAVLFLGTAVSAFAYMPAAHAGMATTATTTAGMYTTHTTATTTSIAKVKKSVVKTLQGKVTQINANSLMLAVSGKEYAVQFSSTTKLINRLWKTASLSSISVGDTVRTYGAVNSTTVTAQVVRDTSLPAVVKRAKATTTSTSTVR